MTGVDVCTRGTRGKRPSAHRRQSTQSCGHSLRRRRTRPDLWPTGQQCRWTRKLRSARSSSACRRVPRGRTLAVSAFECSCPSSPEPGELCKGFVHEAVERLGVTGFWPSMPSRTLALCAQRSICSFAAGRHARGGRAKRGVSGTDGGLMRSGSLGRVVRCGFAVLANTG